MAKKPAPVRKVRSPHGTRVARAVVCRNCGKKDTIHFAPKDPADALCRACAAELLGATDPDAGINVERRIKCVTCGKFEDTTWDGDEAEYACRDCYAGIHTQQGDKTKKAEKISKKVLRKRSD